MGLFSKSAPEPPPPPPSTSKSSTTQQGSSNAPSTEPPLFSDTPIPSQMKEVPEKPPSRSWLSWRRLPKLPNPGKYEELSKESKDCTDITLQSVIDGLSMELGKQFGEPGPNMPDKQFTSTHVISMGSSDPTYAFGSIFATGNNVLIGRWSTEGQVYGRWLYNNGRYGSAIQAQSTLSDPPQVAAEFDYRGTDYYTQFKYNSPYIFGLSYVQSITKKLSLGFEGYYNFPAAMSMNMASFRYVEATKTVRNPSQHLYSPNETITIPSRIWTGQHLNGMNYALTYTQRFSDRVAVSTTYDIGATQEGLESQWAIGGQYEIHHPSMTTARVHIGSDKKVIGILENVIEPNLKLTISSMLDHDKKRFRFGLGFQTVTMGQ